MFNDEWVKVGSASRGKAEWAASKLAEGGVPYWLDVFSGEPVSIMVRSDRVRDARKILASPN